MYWIGITDVWSKSIFELVTTRYRYPNTLYTAVFILINMISIGNFKHSRTSLFSLWWRREQTCSKQTQCQNFSLMPGVRIYYVAHFQFLISIRPLLEEADDEVFDDKELWKVSNELLKMIIATRNPTLWEIFSWAYDSKYLAWAVRWCTMVC